MKKELLEVNNLTVRDGRGSSLERVTFYVFEGECVGFPGLSHSGRDLLMRVLAGGADETLPSSHISVRGMKVAGDAALRKLIYRIRPENYGIGDWTAAEYIGLQRGGWLQLPGRRKELAAKAEEGMKTLGFPVDVQRRLSELPELEKRMVDLVRAAGSGAEILLVEDECEGMTDSDVEAYAAKIRETVLAFGGCALISCNTYRVMEKLADRYIIMRRGRIVKKCRKDYITDSEQLGRFLLGNTLEGRKKTLDLYIQEQTLATDGAPVRYRVKNLVIREGRKADLVFRAGTVTALLVPDRREKERIFMNLSGRDTVSGEPWIDGWPMLRQGDPEQYIRSRIVSVMDLRGDTELFRRMTVGENVLLPSLMKLSSADYTLNKPGLTRLGSGNPELSAAGMGEYADRLDDNGRISMLLERWYLFNPGVFILYEPFAQCDMYGVTLVKSYIRRFANRGTAVVIVKAREEDVGDIADEIITME